MKTGETIGKAFNMMRKNVDYTKHLSLKNEIQKCN